MVKRMKAQSNRTQQFGNKSSVGVIHRVLNLFEVAYRPARVAEAVCRQGAY
jgi:hypothetical protein